jgi:hypothetical protein
MKVIEKKSWHHILSDSPQLNYSSAAHDIGCCKNAKVNRKTDFWRIKWTPQLKEIARMINGGDFQRLRKTFSDQKKDFFFSKREFKVLVS